MIPVIAYRMLPYLRNVFGFKKKNGDRQKQWLSRASPTGHRFRFYNRSFPLFLGFGERENCVPSIVQIGFYPRSRGYRPEPNSGLNKGTDKETGFEFLNTGTGRPRSGYSKTIEGTACRGRKTWQN